VKIAARFYSPRICQTNVEKSTRQTTDKSKIEAALTNEGIFTTYLTNAAGESENDYQAELRSNCGEPS
jgi:hypothetical protein